jgi:hypothetical protein
MQNIKTYRDSSHQNPTLQNTGSTFNSKNKMMFKGHPLFPLVSLGQATSVGMQIQPILSNPYSTSAKGQADKSRVSILTLDLETRQLSGGNLEVISSAIFDGKDYHTHYLTDFANQAEMLVAVVKTLTKYNGYSLYIHNFSRFDGIFLFKYILNLSKDKYQVNFLKRDDKFIKISISKRGDNPKEQDKFNLNIFDSYLLLPNSLRTLSQAFGVEGKLSFNVLNNNTADLNDRLFRSNLLAYNQQDCKALYDVMVSFNKNIKSLFKVDITDIPTLPSLAFKL